MTRASKKSWLAFGIGLIWFYALLWPLIGIKPDGLHFAQSFEVWLKIAAPALILFSLFQLKKAGKLNFITKPLGAASEGAAAAYHKLPTWAVFVVIGVIVVLFPEFTGRYPKDVAINVMIYVCLGLGLNIVVGLAGLLDLGYIAFYGVGAYTYALMSTQFGLSFWICLPLSALFAAIAGCFIGYPTLRMRGDYLAIVTLGFGEIVRLVINNWMSLTNGPNGILGIKAPGAYVPKFDPFSLEHIWLKKLGLTYYVVAAITLVVIIFVYRLAHSRIGRAWEAMREDETAAEIMGVNTFLLKLLAYAMGASIGGVAGTYFAARMRFVSPESFTFLESAMVLAMVVLGGLGSIPGVILGAIALIALPEIFREFELYRMLIFGGVMTLMMLFRPEGLWPAKRSGIGAQKVKKEN
ncbi:MAG: high-affinity branched-chain amino acid ABC transporter permease LivM [Desulfovibrio sp.]